ncbi:MAG: 2-oxo acid dehydrogenase subunit E2 [Phycisphaerales bacterium]|nr:2-oxo acid dehydrogenase subunit E2 [Phycisphaerales bacterium]MCI0631972.1 2-oxo acid dehydrogenase subunit E2 [Phycisphaerales bacterium]MCI0675054.1 2-oxo acid dehydrogenase subunit E2 [Phycisphaerales bacterium]
MAGTKQPSDKSHFILPDLGEGVHEAELIKWRIKPGDRVEEHQTLAEMETDKALVEVPSPWAGVIKETLGKEGDIIKVGSQLVTYETGASQVAHRESRPAASAPSAKPAVAASPAAAKSHQSDEDQGTVVGSVGGSLRVPDRFARRATENDRAAASSKALATPAVRRIAREAGIDINKIPGTGRGGRVTASDVESYAGRGSKAPPAPSRMAPSARPSAGAASAPPSISLPTPITSDGVAQRIPFRGVRRKIAQALHQSVQTAVHFTVVDEADVTALDRKRREYARVLGRKLSLLPFVITALCRALRQHPSLNANVDDQGEEIIIKSVINLGCAVDTEHGLMVPVIPNADKLSIVQLSDAVATLAEQCRNRTIPREQLLGGTFTISNVGSYGGMFATPIINYPEVAILAAGRAKEKVLVKNGAFYAGIVLPLSMSCDHRVVDGAEGARFLNTVVKLLEMPDELLHTS